MIMREKEQELEQQQPTKTSLKLQAYQYLKSRILSCEYAPRQFLNEQKLCAEMGNISRTPMRDALGRLEQEGLITILPKKGLMVSAITDEDVHSIYEVRLLVEPYALRVYGAQIPREGLERFVGLMQHPETIPDFYAADDAFHSQKDTCSEHLAILTPALAGDWDAAAAALTRHLELARDKAEGVLDRIHLGE